MGGRKGRGRREDKESNGAYIGYGAYGVAFNVVSRMLHELYCVSGVVCEIRRLNYEVQSKELSDSLPFSES